MTQPISLNTDHAVTLSIGINVNGDRCEIVLPCATDDTTLSANDLCADAVHAVGAVARPLILSCISPDAYISFIAADGMVDGKVPFRQVYAPTDYPGVLTGAAMPSQVAGLLVFYEEGADVVTGERIRVAHNFIPGIPETEVTGDLVSASLFPALTNLALQLKGPMADTGTKNWYRVLATIRTTATAVRRIGNTGAREWVATQRRRLVPHY